MVYQNYTELETHCSKDTNCRECSCKSYFFKLDDNLLHKFGIVVHIILDCGIKHQERDGNYWQTLRLIWVEDVQTNEN
jgi:hypothetical protein